MEQEHGSISSGPSWHRSLPSSAPACHLMRLDHPNTCLVQFLLEGICNGFHIGFTRSKESLKSARTNLEGAQQHPEIVNDYLSSEMGSGRVVGPFPPRAVLFIHISQFRVIPRGRTGKWRLIVDLSHPHGHSVNDGISKPLCSLKYVMPSKVLFNVVRELYLQRLILRVSSVFFLCSQQTDTCLECNGMRVYTLTLASSLAYVRSINCSIF